MSKLYFWLILTKSLRVYRHKLINNHKNCMYTQTKNPKFIHIFVHFWKKKRRFMLLTVMWVFGWFFVCFLVNLGVHFGSCSLLWWWFAGLLVCGVSDPATQHRKRIPHSSLFCCPVPLLICWFVALLICCFVGLLVCCVGLLIAGLLAASLSWVCWFVGCLTLRYQARWRNGPQGK